VQILRAEDTKWRPVNTGSLRQWGKESEPTQFKEVDLPGTGPSQNIPRCLRIFRKFLLTPTEQGVQLVVLLIFLQEVPAKLAVLFHMANDEDESIVLRAATI